MNRALVWLAAMLVLAAGCAKKASDEAAGGAAGDSYRAVAARPGMVRAPADSIPRGPWMWLGTIGSADTIICPDPSQYTITFLPDSTARLLLFCNRGSGSYRVSGRTLHVGPIATTRMACPPPTLDAEFGQQIEAASSWSVTGDTLKLDIAGFGRMRFVR